MRRLFAILLVIPSVASAGVLFVDYEGTIGVLGERHPPGYETGDPFVGRLVIDTSLAPSDHSILSYASFYGIDDGELHPDFVTGFLECDPGSGGRHGLRSRCQQRSSGPRQLHGQR